MSVSPEGTVISEFSKTPSLPPDSDLLQHHEQDSRSSKKSAISAEQNKASGSGRGADRQKDRSRSSRQPEAGNDPLSITCFSRYNDLHTGPDSDRDGASAARRRPPTSSIEPESSRASAAGTRPSTSSKEPASQSSQASAAGTRPSTHSVEPASQSSQASAAGTRLSTRSVEPVSQTSGTPAARNDDSGRSDSQETVIQSIEKNTGFHVPEGDEEADVAMHSDVTDEYDDSEGPAQDSDSESEDDIDFTPENLHKCVTKDYGLPMRGKVLLWRKMGCIGYQVLVRHTVGNAITYRMEPGSCYVDCFDPKDASTHLPK